MNPDLYLKRNTNNKVPVKSNLGMPNHTARSNPHQNNFAVARRVPKKKKKKSIAAHYQDHVWLMHKQDTSQEHH